MNNKVNYSLYSLKAICAFLVVCLHAPVPFISGIMITPISRIAVPLFFVTTGYFSYTNDKIQMKKKLINLLVKSIKILLIVNIFYLIIRLLIHLYNKNFPIIENFNFYNLFYVSFFAKHLWYITSLIYSSVIFLFLIKVRCFEKIITYICLVMMIISIIMQGNDLTLGVGYLALGFIIRNYEKKLSKIIPHYPRIVLYICFFVVSMCLESFLVYRFIGYNHIVNSIITPFFVSILFLFCLKYNNIKLFASIGKIHSANIYFYHWAFIYLISNLVVNNYIIINPIVIFFISFIFSKIIIQFNQYITTIHKIK